MKTSATRLCVLVLTPLGRRGAGGVDRVMDNLRDGLAAYAPQVDVRFVTTRGRKLWMSPAYMLRAAMLLLAARPRPDVVHINLSTDASTYRKAILAALCRALGLPYVIHLHGSDFREFWPTRKGPLKRLIDHLFRASKAIVLLGDVWRQLVEERLPDVASRITIVPNAAPSRDLSARGRHDGPVLILFLGQLGARKGTPTLLEALARMPGHIPNWRAVLGGDGEVEETKAHVKRLGLGERVDILGWVPSETVDRLLMEADILALPSTAENLPMSVIEGMAAALPVVTTPVGATCDIIKNGFTGLLVPPNDVGALTKALESLVCDPALRATIGRNGWEFHRRHLDVESFTHALVRVWQSAAKRSYADLDR